MFKIGDINIKNNIVLAPIAGISNPSYIKICEEMGVGYAVTELISAEAIVRNNKKTFDMLKGIDTITIPIAIQIFGSNPIVLAQAAQKITKLYPNVLIDINMGCPVPKIAVNSQSGSALLKSPKKAYEIVKAVVNAVSVPVTVKIRSGWDQNNINAIEIAQAIEKAGASAITVHPRTRNQGYSGHANWSIIKEVKANINIPVIGNGDIKTCYDAKKMLDITGCDAVMIGRGLLGNPWLIKECLDYIKQGIKPVIISKNEKLDMLIKHMNYLLKFKNEKLALLEIRTSASYYLKGIKGASEIKQLLFKTKNIQEFKNLIENFMDK